MIDSWHLPADRFTFAPVSWLSSGLFFVAVATLMLEVLDSRLLSVLTWYHLSFLAVSLAMLGMAAGAVLVFLGGARFAANVRRRSRRRRLAFAIAIPISHGEPRHAAPVAAARGGGARGARRRDARDDDPVLPLRRRRHARADATRRAHRRALRRGSRRRRRRLPARRLAARSHRLTSTAFIRRAAPPALGAWCFARVRRRRGMRPALVARGLLVAGRRQRAGDRPSASCIPKSRSLWPRRRAIEYSAWNATPIVVVRPPGRRRRSTGGPARTRQTSR